MKMPRILKRFLSLILGFLMLGFACVIWAWPHHQEPRSQEPEVAPVEVAPVEVATLRRTVRFSAMTRSTKEASLSFGLSARVAGRFVDVGDTVKQGQVLAVLDQNQYLHNLETAASSVEELKTQLRQAQRDRARMDQLAAGNAASRHEVEQVTTTENRARALLEGAEARLSEARRILSEVRLKAPFPGTVTAVFLEPGEWAYPGNPVLTLSGDGDMEIKVEIPESVVVALHPGQIVSVELPFMQARQVRGHLKSVARAATGPGGLFPVVVSLEPVQGLYAGMTAELLVDIDSESCLTVPLQAVLNPGASQPAVFCLRDGKAHLVPVELGRILKNRVVLTGELKPDDRVLVTGHTTLTDGRDVEVRS